MNNIYDVMPIINELALAQESCSTMEYKRIVTEAITGNNNSAKAKLVSLLFQQVMVKQNIDFGRIPDSKGNVTKFKDYVTVRECIETLEGLTSEFSKVNPDEAKYLDDLAALRKLDELLIRHTGDFEYGFKFDVDFLKLMYNTLVLTFIEMTSVCIISYVEFLKQNNAPDYKYKTFDGKNMLIIKNVKTIIKMDEKGELQKLFNAYKKESKNFVGGVGATVVTASVIAILSVVSIVTLLWALRQLVYLFFKTSVKIKEWADLQNTFLKEAMKSESNEKVLMKERKLSNTLTSISDFIAIKILKDEVQAEKALNEDNKTAFTKQELAQTNQLTPSVELL